MSRSWVPFLGALLVYRFLKPERRISLLGTDKPKSLVMAAIPVALLAAFGLIVGVQAIVYCVLEETGWRGYLQDDFRYLNPVVKPILIGGLRSNRPGLSWWPPVSTLSAASWHSTATSPVYRILTPTACCRLMHRFLGVPADCVGKESVEVSRTEPLSQTATLDEQRAPVIILSNEKNNLSPGNRET